VEGREGMVECVPEPCEVDGSNPAGGAVLPCFLLLFPPFSSIGISDTYSYDLYGLKDYLRV
jgi:hypothetical protein